MVGGRAALAKDERIYRFAFPERPGALHNFLHKMILSWNISMLRYRNHGADYGPVLVDFQVPERDYARFKSYLRDLGYSYVSETDYPAYGLFLPAPVPERHPAGGATAATKPARAAEPPWWLVLLIFSRRRHRRLPLLIHAWHREHRFMAAAVPRPSDRSLSRGNIPPLHQVSPR